MKTGKANLATAKTLAIIAEDCDDFLAFLKAAAVKSLRVIADPLSLHADKRARVWLCCWIYINLPTMPKPDPKYHMGLMGVLTDVVTKLHTTEALRPVFTAQREVEKDTKGWDRLPPTAKRVILAKISTNRTSIPTSPPPTIHRFLNTRNVTDLQADCSLTYSGKNIYLPTSFFQALLQGHILAIPEPDAPTGILPLLTPPYYEVPANAQQRDMSIQVLLYMRHDCLSKEEAGELLEQRFHALASTQSCVIRSENLWS